MTQTPVTYEQLMENVSKWDQLLQEEKWDRLHTS